MELLDRYIQEVGRHLSHKDRHDVQMELRSLLLDSIEQRAAGAEASDESVAEVLREFGHPEDVAARYSPTPRYLIGPRLYPAFRSVVGVILIGFAALFGVTVILIPLVVHGGAVPDWSTLARGLFGYVQTAALHLVAAAIVFAILERRSTAAPQVERTWDPKQLPPLKAPDRVPVADRVFRIYWFGFILAILNFYPRWIGLILHPDIAGSWVIPLESFGIHLPILLIDASLVLAILLDVKLLRQGRWLPVDRWSEVGLELLSAGILFYVWTTLTPVDIAALPQHWADSITRSIGISVLLIAMSSVLRSAYLVWKIVSRHGAPVWNSSGAAVMH